MQTIFFLNDFGEIMIYLLHVKKLLDDCDLLRVTLNKDFGLARNSRGGTNMLVYFYNCKH